jgi:hypothetical protein
MMVVTTQVHAAERAHKPSGPRIVVVPVMVMLVPLVLQHAAKESPARDSERRRAELPAGGPALLRPWGPTRPRRRAREFA